MEVFDAINVALGTVSDLNDVRCSRVARSHLGEEPFYPYLVADPDPRLEWSSGFMTECQCGRMFVRKTLREGTFMCPLCQEEQHYKLKEVWLKCHWCWMIRCCGEKLVEYAKCKKCGFHYQPDVALDWSTSKTKKALDDVKLHAMISMALLSEKFTKVLKSRIQFDDESLTKSKPTGSVETSRTQDLECFKTEQQQVKAELQCFTPFLSGQQKDDIINSMVSVAMEYGDNLDQAQVTWLFEVASVLDVPEAHVEELCSVTRHSESEAIGGMPGAGMQRSRQEAPPKRYDCIPPGTNVSLKGLVARPERNGDMGVVQQYNPQNGRYVVQLEDTDETMSVKASNLLQHVHVRINGKTGTIMAWNPRTERYNINVMALEKVVGLKPTNVVLENGTVGSITGLKSKPELNGQWGTIKEWIQDSNKYDVQLSADKIIRIEAENIRVHLDAVAVQASGEAQECTDQV